VDAGLNVYVAGTTNSSDFPVTSSNAFQASPKSAGNHAFVTKLNSSGGGPVYSSYVSGSSVDAATGVAVGPLAGTVFVTGTTQSNDFVNVAKAAGRGTSQFFLTKLNTGGHGAASLVYSDYVGGTSPASAATDGGGVAVDSSGNAYITGGTTYTDMPAVNAFQSTLKGTENAFIAKFNPNGTAPPVFLTYLGGSGTDIGNGVATDSAGNAYVTGSTTSSDFPVLASPGSSIYQGTFGGATDGFATKITSTGRSLIWSTFIGGSGNDSGLGIAVDANQNTFVTGSTTSTNLNVTNATQSTFGGGTDAFVGKFDIAGGVQFVTYLGGSGTDSGTGIAVDSSGNPFVAGETNSTGLATTGVFQNTPKGGTDAFVARFGGVSHLNLSAAVTPNPVGIGNPATFTFTVTNTGPDIATAVALSDAIPANGVFQSATPSQGTCSGAAGSPPTVVCSLGQLAVNASATVTLQVASTVAGALSDTATVTSSSTVGNSSAVASTAVNDYTLSVSPTTASVPDGQAATYTVTVGPIPQGAGFPNGVSLRCSGGVPTAAMCAFSTNPVTPNASAVTSSLTISTTAPPPGTTARLFRQDWRMYAVILPLGGMVWLGFAVGPDGKKRRRLAGLLLLVVVAAATGFQLACSSSSSKPTQPLFTPTGSYTITVAAVSGSVTHTVKISMAVQ
jgi:uncharacterized repeat protein (TIGR01451 family)